MVAKVRSGCLFGVDAFQVDVEVFSQKGTPNCQIVGMPETSVRESIVRIRGALKSIGSPLPRKKVYVNLAPADRKKKGSGLDLAIALGILSTQKLTPTRLSEYLFWGELGVDGSIKSAAGALSACLLARRIGCKGFVTSPDNVDSLSLVEGIDIRVAQDLSQVCAFVQGDLELPKLEILEPSPPPSSPWTIDDVRGQRLAKRAVEIAVAGGHNLLLIGPPGSGKTMLAKSIVGLLPPLSRTEQIEVAKIHNAVATSTNAQITRPFRVVHQNTSLSALLGGGTFPSPGELSLAHRGVLFLDELPEFPRSLLEALRQPIEDRQVHIGRINGSVNLPAAFTLVASANPCPCGFHGSTARNCVCSLGTIRRYRSRLSGPILDRVDIQVFVDQPELDVLRTATRPPLHPKTQARILRARQQGQERYAHHGFHCNSDLPPPLLEEFCSLSPNGETTLKKIFSKRGLMTARTVHRVLRVSRTIADLENSSAILPEHLLEAINLRFLDAVPLQD